LSVGRNWNWKGGNSDKVAALREILDRGFGKPRETVDIKGGPRIIEILLPSGKKEANVG
jgi:hypothetical protein